MRNATFVTSYMKQNKSRKQTLESAQYGLEISFKSLLISLQPSSSLKELLSYVSSQLTGYFGNNCQHNRILALCLPRVPPSSGILPASLVSEATSSTGRPDLP